MADPDQEPELFDEDAEERLGPFADAAAADERQRPGKRGRGRPKLSPNRKTLDFERYYQAMGWEDPLKRLAQVLTSDPVELQSWIIEHERAQKALGKHVAMAVPSLIEIMEHQRKCAVDLAPYLHGKKPVQLQAIDERLPYLVIDLGTNQLDQARAIEQQRALSLGQQLPVDEIRAEATEINEINDLDGDEIDQSHDEKSHGGSSD